MTFNIVWHRLSTLKQFLYLIFLKVNRPVNHGGRCSYVIIQKCTWLGSLSNFVHFIHPYMNPLPKMSVLKNFVNFTGKHLCCFPERFCKFLRISFFTEHFRWLLLEEFCERSRLVKILRFFHFKISWINHRCSLIDDAQFRINQSGINQKNNE